MPAAVPTHFLPGVSYRPMQTSQREPTMEARSSGSNVIDGTPSRVASIAVVSLAVLIGLRWAGIKFNVAVGS